MQNASTDGDGSVGLALGRISAALVQLYARRWGHGPTRAKAHLAGDTVICVMRDPYNQAERTLLAANEVATVQQGREQVSRLLRADLRRIVEENLGRRVIGNLAMTHVDPDIAVEVIVLEPWA